MRRLTILALAAMAFTASAFGLEAKDGRIKLVVDDRTGRFSLYYLVDVTRNRYEPLLYDQETRTTYATLMVDGKAFRLGDAPEFRIAVSREASGKVRVEYRSSFCVVRQLFSFVTSPGAPMADGVTIQYSIENVSKAESAIGLRVLLDTYVGEKSAAHFVAQGVGPLVSERALSGDYADSWVRGLGSAELSAANLQVLLGEPATRPDTLLAANWKRLNDSSWFFEANPSRNFTLLPYSINDSALALYYEPAPVRPGSTRAVVVGLSQAVEGYDAYVAAKGDKPPVVAIAAPSATAPLDEMADLIAVRAVLEAIDAMLAAGQAPNAAELEALETTLRRLEARKGQY